MDTVIQHAKVETLLAMYQSVGRMNQAILEGNQEVYQSEVGLQQNLRGNFRELLEEV